MNDHVEQPAATAAAAAEERATYRLVIRARITPEALSGSPAPHSRSTARWAAIATVGLAAVAALGWVGGTLLPMDSGPKTATELAREPQSRARSRAEPAAEPVPVASESPRTAEIADATSGRIGTATATEVQTATLDGTPRSTQEVLPEPPSSALRTIRGTVRVAIRVTIDAQGAVIAADSHEAGPSRYFERLSLDAARKWTFVPAATNEPRSALLRFHFTRSGTTARASSL